MAEWWVEEEFGGDEDAALEWGAAFKEEHGYLPDEDPDLLGKGLSPNEAMAEHLRAKSWGEEYKRSTGETPDYHDYRYGQPRRYKYGQLISGFGGYPPESYGKRPDWVGGTGMGEPWMQAGYPSSYAYANRRVPPANTSSGVPFSLGRRTRNVPALNSGGNNYGY